MVSHPTVRKILFLSHYGANPQFQQFFAETAKQSSGEVKAIIPREVVYTNGWRPQLFPERKVINGVEYIPSDLFDKKRYHLSGYWPELPKTILQFKPDTVIVTDEVYTIDAWFVNLYKLLFLKRFQIITWSQAHYMESAQAIRREGRWLLRWNKLFIKKFVTRNNQLAARIRAVLPPHKKVQVVYWSTNPEQFKPLHLTRQELLAKLDFTNLSHLADTEILGFVGRLVPEKGLLDLIEHFSELPEHTAFLIIGQGDSKYITQLKTAITTYHLENRCYVLGDKPYDLLVYFYNLINIFILPTKKYNNYYELFGRVLPEAMMCKTLVLGSTNGAIPEVIHNPLCLFQQGNNSDMIQKLRQLLELSSTEKQAAIEQNYRYALANFTVEAFAKNLLTLVDA